MKLTKSFWMKIIPMVAMVLATAFLSIVLYIQMMDKEQESCWERLELATNSTAEKIQVRLDDNMNFLESVADSHVLMYEMQDIKKVGKYLTDVMDTTIFERIDVIQPDNSLITQKGEITERNGKSSYEELVAMGTHISGRRTSSFTGNEVICCVTPIEKDGETLGLLVGTIDCEKLGEMFEVFTYRGESQLFMIDCSDGNYIIDNWHSELGNIYELGERKSAEGNAVIDMTSAIINRENARFSFVSETNGKKSYQYCTPIENYNWELCVVVQEDVAFANVNQLSRSLKIVAHIEVVIILLYIAWNILIMTVASKNEEKAKKLEYEKAKNEARTRFISNMSHDIKTPLNGIVGMLQIIENHRTDDKKVDDCLKKIAVSTQYLSTLASDMLDINEIENNKLVLLEEPINLKTLTSELEVMVEQRARDVGVECYMDCSGLENPYIIGSDVHIKRILVNLIGNSIKYSKDAGKKVWVTIQDEKMKFDKTRQMYKFVVKDNGIGMTKEFQKNMYNAFEQEKISARSDYQGYGLGLTIVNYLVKRMNGTIEIESEKGVGSTFTVSIPFRIDKGEERKEQDKIEVVDLSGMKILVVEDNEFNLEVAEVLLTDVGATIEVASNGKIATEMFAASEVGTYDLILMDIMMPIMDGCEATRVIRTMEREDAKTVPIIAMTASTFAEEIQRCETAGMDAHISKPLNVHKLMMEIIKYK